jgi:hypothetical protein
MTPLSWQVTVLTSRTGWLTRRPLQLAHRGMKVVVYGTITCAPFDVPSDHTESLVSNAFGFDASSSLVMTETASRTVISSI